MKLLLVVVGIFLLSGCVPDIQSILKQQASNCNTHITGNIGGSTVGLQTGVISFSLDCAATGVPPTTPTPATGAAAPATKSPQSGG